MPQWIDAGFEQYARRFPRETKLNLVELKVEPRGSDGAAGRAVTAEAKRIRAATPREAVKIVMDERGREWTTRELAARMAEWRMQGGDTAFVIGGPDGLHESVRDEAHHVWSLSKLTLPHGLVRVILAEQLYRAHSILGNHPYHRE